MVGHNIKNFLEEKKMKEDLKKVYSKIEFDALMYLEFDESDLGWHVMKLGEMLRAGGCILVLGYHLSPTTVKKEGKMLLCIKIVNGKKKNERRVREYIEKYDLGGKIEIY
jgi:hypothetical protein